MKLTETVEITGHLMDTGVLARVLDDVLEYGGDYKVDRLDLGREHDDESYARIAVGADDADTLQRILNRVQIHGVNPVNAVDADLQPAPADGVFPDEFYSTTNLDDPGAAARPLAPGGPGRDGLRAVVRAGLVHNVPVADVRADDLVVCGATGVRVTLPVPDELADEQTFGFMASTVSSEKPQALLVRRIAERLREVKAAGDKVLWVGGPAIVHTGAAPRWSRWCGPGSWTCCSPATRWPRTTSRRRCSARRSASTSTGAPACRTATSTTSARSTDPGGRVDRRRRRAGRAHRRRHARDGQGGQGIRAGRVGTRRRSAAGRLHRRHRGPARDAGPAGRVGFCVMVATMLHSIATGNILPASVPLVCVDINPATVTKLADRGSAQAIGIVTDIGLFLEQLARELVPDYPGA